MIGVSRRDCFLNERDPLLGLRSNRHRCRWNRRTLTQQRDSFDCHAKLEDRFAVRTKGPFADWRNVCTTTSQRPFRATNDTYTHPLEPRFPDKLPSIRMLVGWPSQAACISMFATEQQNVESASVTKGLLAMIGMIDAGVSTQRGEARYPLYALGCHTRTRTCC